MPFSRSLCALCASVAVPSPTQTPSVDEAELGRRDEGPDDLVDCRGAAVGALGQVAGEGGGFLRLRRAGEDGEIRLPDHLAVVRELCQARGKAALLQQLLEPAVVAQE